MSDKKTDSNGRTPKTPVLTVFDPDGDVILAVGNPELRFKVASSVLCRVSTPMQAMLDGPFKEAFELAATQDKPYKLLLPGDNAKAFLSICQILYFQHDKLPAFEDIEIDWLNDLAVAVDKWDLSSATSMVTRYWLSMACNKLLQTSLEHTHVPTEVSTKWGSARKQILGKMMEYFFDPADIGKILICAYRFDDADAFWIFTKHLNAFLAIHTLSSFRKQADPNKHLPTTFWHNLKENLEMLNKVLSQKINDAIATYVNRDDRPRYDPEVNDDYPNPGDVHGDEDGYYTSGIHDALVTQKFLEQLADAKLFLPGDNLNMSSLRTKLKALRGFRELRLGDYKYKKWSDNAPLVGCNGCWPLIPDVAREICENMEKEIEGVCLDCLRHTSKKCRIKH